MAAIMKSLCFTFIILASSATLFSVTDAWRFNVGGNGDWTIKPKENYKTWAERNRFQVNDTLYFKYAKGSDSVQQVMKADFDGCNIRNPLKSFDDGESVVPLNRSGPFYFISGNQDHCKKGQKLIVVVLAIRNHTISPAKPPSTAQPPKSPSPVSPVAPAKPPTVAQPPKSHSPVSPVAPAKPPTVAQPPKSHSPVSPAKPPSMAQPPKSSVSPTHPPKSSSPVSHSPSVAPSHAPAKSPATQSPSPSPKSPSPASSPSSPSDQSPTSSPPTEQTPPTSPSPSETTPTADNVTAPAPSPKRSGGGKAAVTSVMATVLSAAFTVLMFA